MLYDVILKLNSGEYVSIYDIVSISWTKGRTIFVTDDDRSYIYYKGDIVTCNIEMKGGRNEPI